MKKYKQNFPKKKYKQKAGFASALKTGDEDSVESWASSIFKPQSELSYMTSINSQFPDAPEKKLTRLALHLAIIEKTATGLRELAFIWATVVLLGGFASALKPKDFWFVTAILIVEGARLFGRTRELEWQHQSSRIESHLFNPRRFFKAAMRTVSFIAPRSRSLVLKKLLWMFISKNITRLLYWLQIVAAAACVALSLVRLGQQDYGNNGQTNEKSALNVFYGLSLAEALMFLSGKFYWTWRIGLGKLVEKVCDDCELERTEMASLHRFFYDAYSKCIDGSVFDGLKMDLVSFAKEQLDSDSLDEQISGAGILQSFVETDRFAADTLRKIGSSTPVIERLIEMLNWKDPAEKKIRRSAAKIVSKLASRKQQALRVAAIPGAMESIGSLLHTGGRSTEEEIFEASPRAEVFNQLGLLILERLARDHGNSGKIGKARGLLARIINLTSARAELRLYHKSNSEQKSRIETVRCALQVVKILVCTTGQTGRMLRKEISKIVYLVSNVREVLLYGLDHGSRDLKLQKLGVELLKSLGMDEDARDKIGATGSMLRLILTVFFQQRQAEEAGEVCNEAGEALAMLLLESPNNCERMLRENDVVGRLVAALADPVLKVNASRILRGLCAYSAPEHSIRFRALADAVPMVLKTIMEEKEKENEKLLEVSIELEEEEKVKENEKLLEVSIEIEEEEKEKENEKLLDVSIELEEEEKVKENEKLLEVSIKIEEEEKEKESEKLLEVSIELDEVEKLKENEKLLEVSIEIEEEEKEKDKENEKLLERFIGFEEEEKLLEGFIEHEGKEIENENENVSIGLKEELLEASIGLAHQILKLGNPDVLKNGIMRAGIKDQDFAGKLVQILRKYESPERKVPIMRIFVVELASTLMSYEHEYIKLFRDLGMEEVLTQIAKTTSELECFNIFSGSVGLSRHREMLSSLVDNALVLLA